MDPERRRAQDPGGITSHTLLRINNHNKADMNGSICPVPPSGGICVTRAKLFKFSYFAVLQNVRRYSTFAAAAIADKYTAATLAAAQRAAVN